MPKKKSLAIGIIAAVILLGIVAAVAFSKYSPFKKASQVVTEEDEHGGNHGSYEEPMSLEELRFVLVENGKLNPPELKVKVGDEVGINNKDTKEHSFVSTSPISEYEFSTGILKPGQKIELLRLAKPGKIDYHCELHPEEIGTIVVEEVE